MSLHQQQVHPEYVEGCFGCKVSTISVQNGHIRAISHANDKELDAYRNARKQGIQPASTRMPDIQKAVQLSDKLGKAAKA